MAGTARVRGVALVLLTATHVVNDMYTSAVPALLPYFVAERQYAYAVVGGVLLAATLLSCLVLPGFGILSDRHRLGWLVPGGMLVAGLGVGLAGVVDDYLVTCLAVAVSGVGVAAYHPESAKVARSTVGDSAQGMSIFSVGGNVGIALGPIGVALVLNQTGLRGTPLLAAPAVAMALAYALAWACVRGRDPSDSVTRAPGPRRRAAGGARDDWKGFALLVGVIIARAVGSVGSGSLIALFVIDSFDRSIASGSVVLAVLSGGGIVGTLLGGWLADRVGRVESFRVAYLVAPFAMAALIMAPSYEWALSATVVLGVAMFMPFAVQLVLGQDFLPNRLGTASGVTLGFSITAAGLFTPVLGAIADAHGLGAALWLGCGALVVAWGLSMRLDNPASAARRALTPAR